ncbi:hypothetical protein AYO38_05720 [bacterium SCGC AG-212-C10]|nr:hypothetical protein AYO38_05720 [bacterium SCGC AG-212-C10]
MSHPSRIAVPAILDAANALVAEAGAERVSMREVARRLGVSAPSLYFHVASREALLDLVIREGLRRLGESLQAHVRGAISTRVIVRRMGEGYVQFGLANPHLFSLLFGPCDPESDRAEASDLASRTLLDVVATLVPEDDVLPVAQTLWSFVHGFTMLKLNGRFQLGDPDRTLDRGLELILDGLGIH